MSGRLHCVPRMHDIQQYWMRMLQNYEQTCSRACACWVPAQGDGCCVDRHPWERSTGGAHLSRRHLLLEEPVTKKKRRRNTQRAHTHVCVCVCVSNSAAAVREASNKWHAAAQRALPVHQYVAQRAHMQQGTACKCAPGAGIRRLRYVHREQRQSVRSSLLLECAEPVRSSRKPSAGCWCRGLRCCWFGGSRAKPRPLASGLLERA